jgi:hypothetical protein
MGTISHPQVRTASSFFNRLIGAALLDGSVYEDVEADPRATIQAAAVVLLASAAPVVGLSTFFGFQIDALLRVAALSIGTWILWAVLIFQIGVRLMPDADTKSSLGELLRTTGFAAAPGMLQVFVAFPGMMWPVFVGTWIWMIAAMVVGVEHALDYRSARRALLVCVTAATLAATIAFVIGLFFGPVAY